MLLLVHYAYLYFNLKSNIIEANTIVIELNIIIGISDFRIPYINQRIIPIKNNRKVAREISLVSFNFHILITCGTKAIVVRKPAISPKMIT